MSEWLRLTEFDDNETTQGYSNVKAGSVCFHGVGCYIRYADGKGGITITNRDLKDRLKAIKNRTSPYKLADIEFRLDYMTGIDNFDSLPAINVYRFSSPDVPTQHEINQERTETQSSYDQIDDFGIM